MLGPATSCTITIDRPGHTLRHHPTAGPALPFSHPTMLAALLAIVSTGAIFGFFYAWVCSTMIGLDDADPRVAIEAMQAMNARVRNPIFMPAFFLTPALLATTAVLARRDTQHRAARHFAGAAAIYLLGGLVLTATINVPMNEQLAVVDVPTAIAEAAAIWDAYSTRWQAANVARTVAAGLSLTVATLGLAHLSAHR